MGKRSRSPGTPNSPIPTIEEPDLPELHCVRPLEEVKLNAPATLQGPEPVRELGIVLQRSELALRVQVVVGDVRPAVALTHRRLSTL
jgi:hypothetical protein